MSLDDSTAVQALIQGLGGASSVLVVSHVRPDGDAIGSLLGLGLALQAAGRNVQMVSADGVPANFRHLQGSDQVRHQPEGAFDFICVLDCSDLERVGAVLEGYPPPDLNLDHHKTNLNFARINLVDIGAVSTTEIIAGLMPLLDLPMTKPVAEALLTGLITDTIGFRTSNMTSKALRLAADLVDGDLDMPELYRRALVNRSYEATRLWGVGLVKLERNGRMVWTTLTMADRETANYPGRDDADLINVLVAIDEADIAMIFIEQPNGRIKVSWRARPGIDVSGIALRFGGGGHPAASGADIQGSLPEVQAAVLSQTHSLISAERSAAS